MVAGQRVLVVLPAYNAARTLEAVHADIPRDIVDDVLLVDDASGDATAELARRLGIRTIVHPANRGYGANQKTCYREALRTRADIVVMIHPDYQYPPRLAGAMAWMIASGLYDLVLGSRILSGHARSGGMPLYKFVGNRLLTAFQNLLAGAKLSEYHTGFRAFNRRVLETLPLEENSDDFVFDNQLLAQALAWDFRIGEVSSPTRYFSEASSIGLLSSIRYGLGVVKTSVDLFAHRNRLWRPRYLAASGRRIAP